MRGLHIVLYQTGFKVKNEPVVFNFAKDYDVWVPYVKSKAKDIEGQYFNSFENTYTYTSLSKMSQSRLAFTPLLVALNNGKKFVLQNLTWRATRVCT